jgi:hypothetical protein
MIRENGAEAAPAAGPRAIGPVEPLVPDGPNQMIVRMYRQGLGDCFLLALPAAHDETKYVLIDCGVHMRQTDGTARLAQVMRDLAAATRSQIDLLVASHEHADHLSGFVQRNSPFLEDQFVVRRVWLAWTEKRGDAQADALRKKRGTAQRLIDKAIRQAQQATGFGSPHLAARLARLTDFEDPAPESVDAAAVAAKIASLGGTVPGAGGPGNGGAPALKKKKEEPTSNELALGLLVAKAGAGGTDYCEPGKILEVEDVGHLRAYVLGPPRTDLLKKDAPSKIRGGREGGEGAYKEVYLSGTPSDRALGMSPGLAEEDEHAKAMLDDWRHPFPVRFRRGCQPAAPSGVGTGRRWDGQMPPPRETMSFVGGSYFDPAASWRRIDGDWLSAAEELALNLAADTNNTSLVLAFEWGQPGKGRVLLFAADAQVGNWLSWRDQQYGDGQSADDILSRVVLYKVGHHGSHNATVRRDPREVSTAEPLGAPFGLELMDDILAMMPVDWDAVRKEMPDPWRMPHEPLYRKLREKARRRVLRCDERLEPLDKRDEPDLFPKKTQWQTVPGLDGVLWRRSKEEFADGTPGPLYYDVAITLPD